MTVRKLQYKWKTCFISSMLSSQDFHVCVKQNHATEHLGYMVSDLFISIVSKSSAIHCIDAKWTSMMLMMH